MHSLSGKKILVTGATGFIGGRLIEKLFQDYNVTVRALVRNFARALHIARYPVEVVHGDINEPQALRAAAEGCDIIVHCAYGSAGNDSTRRAANTLGTKNALDAALAARIKRFVHLSTLQVYGRLSDGDLDETHARRPFGDSYSDSKLEAENLVLEYFASHGLPVVILQPTIVYGPHSLIWTTNVLLNMRKQRQILVDDGAGFCNAVYIDDVVDAIILAAARDQGVGESFLISGEQPVTWREFYGSYERMLGISATVSLSATEAEKYVVRKRAHSPSIVNVGLSLLREEPLIRQRLLKSYEVEFLTRFTTAMLPAQLVSSMKRWVKGEDGGTLRNGNGASAKRPVRLLSFPLDAKYYATRARVRIDKANRLLGYKPAFDLAAGMDRTEQWARWTNLLNG